MKRGPILFLAALGVIVILATIVSQFASDEPDGLEYVAEQEGFADTAEEHTLGEAPLADYGEGADGGWFGNRAVAGLVGGGGDAGDRGGSVLDGAGRQARPGRSR